MKKTLLIMAIILTSLSATDYIYECENRTLTMTVPYAKFNFESATYNGMKFEGRGENGNMIMFESANGTRLGFVDNGGGDTYLIFMTGSVHTTIKCTHIKDIY